MLAAHSQELALPHGLSCYPTNSLALFYCRLYHGQLHIVEDGGESNNKSKYRATAAGCEVSSSKPTFA